MNENVFRATRLGPVLLAWGLLGLVFVPQALLLNQSRPDPWPEWLVVTRNLEIFLLWALFTPVLLAAMRRWPPEAGRRIRNGLRIAAVALVLVALHVLLMALSTVAWISVPVDFEHVLVSTAAGLAATNVLMAATVCIAGAAQMHFAARRRAEAQLVEARLAALRHQLQPHFLFNTLNALAELAHRDAARTESLLLRLSALLRRALSDGSARRIPLAEELKFLDDYLQIQQALLGDRLAIRLDIEPAANEASLPPMLLQPLVENALRHGISPRPEGGRLELSARRDARTLHIEVRDDGVGLDRSARDGVGLRNTRERLAAEYGNEARFEVMPADGGGTLVRLRLPWRSA